MAAMRLEPGEKVKFLGCEVLYRECCLLAARSPLRVDVEFLPKGLHDLVRAEMQARLQQAVDAADARGGYRAILLGYARCNDGLVGLTARSSPLVIARAHDCISFFFGGHGPYQAYFDAHPGTYFHTTGWLERNDPRVEGSQGLMQRLGLDQTYEELVARHGQENADYIVQTLGGGLEHYTNLCYLRMDATDETRHVAASRSHAAGKGWTFDLRQGDWSLLEKLFAGRWDDDFVVVPPGGRLSARNDGRILAAERPD